MSAAFIFGTKELTEAQIMDVMFESDLAEAQFESNQDRLLRQLELDDEE